MKVSGMRGKYSPMNSARTTEAQTVAIDRLLIAARKGKLPGFSPNLKPFSFEVRYPAYIGDGLYGDSPCAATRGAITVSIDGRIYANVEKDGTLS